MLDVRTVFLNEQKPFKGKQYVITAGPTREKIDPVRFISNHSTGKMGYAIAEEAKDKVPCYLSFGTDSIRVTITWYGSDTSRKLHKKCIMRPSNIIEADVVIKTAAVADYRPKYVMNIK